MSEHKFRLVETRDRTSYDRAGNVMGTKEEVYHCDHCDSGYTLPIYNRVHVPYQQAKAGEDRR